MLKKSLVFGSLVFLFVMAFALGGCEGPVGPAGTPGKDGTQGTPGNSFLGIEKVGSSELEVAYRTDSKVIIPMGVKVVEGEVPAGKSLIITGGDVKVGPKGLTVNGTLEIMEEGILRATGLLFPLGTPLDEEGFLKAGSGAKISGDGMIVLPYPVDDSFTSGLAYTSPEVRGVGTVIVGSLAVNGTINGTFGSADLAAIFDLPSKPGELNAAGIGDLDAGDIPQGRTLNLYLDGNEVVPDGSGLFTLTGTNAKLNVKAGAELTIPASTTVSATAGAEITNEEGGTIILLANDSVLDDGEGGYITNNGTIQVDDPDPSDNLLKALAIKKGEGWVKVNKAGTVILDIATGLNQNIIVPSGVTLQSGNTDTFFTSATAGRTLRIEKGGVLDLQSITDFALVDIDNKGTITTATTLPAFLETIFARSDKKGAIEAAGTLAARDEDFTIPQGIELTSASFNFTTPDKEVVIEGKYTLSAASAPPGNVTVKGGGRLDLDGYDLTLGAGKILDIPGAVNVEGAGSITAYDAQPTNTPKIRIAGADYTTVSAGVAADVIKKILEVFDEDYDKLTDTVDLAGEFGGAKGIGAVQLINTSATPISTRGDGANPNFELTITSAIEVMEGFSADIDIPDLVDIQISTDPNGKVQIADPRYNTNNNAAQKYVVINFNKVRLLRDGLYSPVVDPFHIGVRTNRAQ
jgi:hypothetical protein